MVQHNFKINRGNYVSVQCTILTIWGEQATQGKVEALEPEKVVEEEEDGTKRKISNSDKKDTTNKKFLFTLLQSTVDVRVSAYETTLKKMYQQLMKDIKKYPEDVIDTLKDKKKKDVLSTVTLSTSVVLGTTSDEQEQARLENEAYKLDFVHQKKGCSHPGSNP